MKKPICVALHGAPRSGTSWLGQILNSSPDVKYAYQPLFSYAFKDYLNETSTYTQVDSFFRELAASDDAFINQRDPEIHKNVRQFHKNEITHVIYKEVRYHHILANMLKVMPELRVAGVYRHPCAVLSSWLNAPREFSPDWDFGSEWRHAAKKNNDRPEEYYGYDKWKELLEIFIKLKHDFPDRFKLIYYADLIKSTDRIISDLFDFIDLDITGSTLDFIHESTTIHDMDTYSVYRARKDDNLWRKDFPKDIEAEILADLEKDSLDTYF